MGLDVRPPALRTGFLLLCALSCALQGCAVAPVQARDSAGFSFDGLALLENTRMSRVWVRDGMNLAGYRKVLFAGAEIQYRPVPSDPGNTPRHREFPLSDAQKRELEQLIVEEFDKAVRHLTLETVTSPGPDVLRVRGYLLDVVSSTSTGAGDSPAYWLDSVGQATFVIELIDSQSNAVLVRALDTRAARTPGVENDSNDPDAAMRQLLSNWAQILVDALNDLTAIDELQGA